MLSPYSGHRAADSEREELILRNRSAFQYDFRMKSNRRATFGQQLSD
jgi:hypothetical protein